MNTYFSLCSSLLLPRTSTATATFRESWTTNFSSGRVSSVVEYCARRAVRNETPVSTFRGRTNEPPVGCLGV